MRAKDIHPLLFGVFAALLLIPAFFWAGGKLFHVRVDALPLILAAGTLFVLMIIRKR